MNYFLFNLEKKRKSIFIFILYFIFALAVNCLGSMISTNISFPLYLDSILTIGITAMYGLIPGILCATFSNLILFIFDYTMLPFISCHIITAIFAWLVFLKEKKSKNFKAFSINEFLWAGLWSAISNSLLGNMIADLVFGALVDKANIVLPVQGIYVVTKNLIYSTYLSGTLTNLVDKMLSTILSFGLYLFYLKKH